ncbi:class I SAM-dependent methyltransferase [Paenibacillus chitinolyticus]|uniref:class I SAM-dependent methyltransferase n=1 Tax=Paenibacillus chitinolyticus TaxID=79263 RepID=UPI00364B2E00
MNTHIPFHQFQRYKMVELIIDAFRNGRTFSILEVGANEHKNLELFLKDDILYLDIKLSEELKRDPSFVEGDATDLKFADSSFDIVVALDVIEHIPKNRRVLFLKEIDRVSKLGFIISAPFENSGIEQAEIRISNYYQALYDSNLLWNEEHREQGLPNKKEIFDYLIASSKKEIVPIDHGNIEIWEKFIQMEFISGLSEKMIPYWHSINEYYNNVLFLRDFADQSVRTFFVGISEKKGANILTDSLSEWKQDLTERHNNQIDFFLQSLTNLNFSLQSQIPSEADISNLYFAQMFLDFGEGFKEENSETRVLVLKDKYQYQSLSFELNKSEEVHSIRIDPINTSSCLQIINIRVADKQGNEYTIKNYETNAEFKYNNEFIYLNNDPQIVIASPEKSILSITLDILYKSFDFGISNEVVNIITDEKTKNKSIKEKLLESELKAEAMIKATDQKNNEINRLGADLLNKDNLLAEKLTLIMERENENILLKENIELLKENIEKINSELVHLHTILSEKQKEIDIIENNWLWKLKKIFTK